MDDQDRSTEQWRIIAEAPDYAVSDFGRVKRITADRQGRGIGRILRPDIVKGYRRYTLVIDGQSFHYQANRLVCAAFNGLPPSPKHHAAHEDGKRTNDMAGNIYWATPKQNAADRERHGRTARGSRHGLHIHPESILRGEDNRNKLKESDVIEIANTPKTFGSGRALARKFGVCQHTISRIRCGRSWKHI